MDFVAPSDEPQPLYRASSRTLSYGVLAMYGMVLAAAVLHHEPWADEAQSWLLARDASLPELWTRLLHYEGTPGLWQTILYSLIKLGLPYSGINFISAILAFGASWILVQRAPFPLAIRLTLPFTYFLCYQYSVVARSYCLLPLLLFAAAALFDHSLKRAWAFIGLLVLMADVSVHGFVLSLCIAAATVARHHRSLLLKEHWKPLLTYLVLLVPILFSALPAHDGTFVTRLNLSWEHLHTTSLKAFSQAFTGEPFSSLALVAFSLPSLWRGGGLLVFALASLLLCLVNGVVYSQVWHSGVLFLIWIFALWISGRSAKFVRLAFVSLGIVIGVQWYSTIAAIHYDWIYPYSGSEAAARYLKQQELSGRTLYGIGYACVAVQPYFEANVFANFAGGGPQAYWDWSSRNRSLKDLDRLALLNPEYVMVGYTGLAEKLLWSYQVRHSGYEAVRHFEGNLFWRTAVLEPASFDLYRRKPGP